MPSQETGKSIPDLTQSYAENEALEPHVAQGDEVTNHVSDYWTEFS